MTSAFLLLPSNAHNSEFGLFSRFLVEKCLLSGFQEIKKKKKKKEEKKNLSVLSGTLLLLNFQLQKSDDSAEIFPFDPFLYQTNGKKLKQFVDSARGNGNTLFSQTDIFSWHHFNRFMKRIINTSNCVCFGEMSLRKTPKRYRIKLVNSVFF